METVQRLLQSRGLFKIPANPNKGNYFGITPLHLAARNGHAGVVKALLDFGADADVQDYEGITPLHRAAKYEHTFVLEALLRAGANANVQDEDGITPLRWASARGNVAIINLLLRAGAGIGANFLDVWNLALIFNEAQKHGLPLIGARFRQGIQPPEDMIITTEQFCARHRAAPYTPRELIHFRRAVDSCLTEAQAQVAGAGAAAAAPAIGPSYLNLNAESLEQLVLLRNILLSEEFRGDLSPLRPLKYLAAHVVAEHPREANYDATVTPHVLRNLIALYQTGQAAVQAAGKEEAGPAGPAGASEQPALPSSQNPRSLG